MSKLMLSKYGINLFYFAVVDLGKSGAASRHTLEICNNLAQLGHHIWLFVPYPPSLTSESLHPNIQIIPVLVLRIPKQIIVTILFYFAVSLVSWRYFRQLHPHVVYTRASFLDFIAIAPLRLFFKFDYVAEINGIRSLETTGSITKRRLIALLERFSMGLCDKAIGVTPELRQWAIKIGKLQPEQTTTIGNGVPIDLFHPIPAMEAKRDLNLDPRKRYLNFTGSLKSWHGTHLLIEALPTVLAEFPADICLLIVGDGPERQTLVKLARQLDVDYAVKWVGSVSIQKVPLYINASEICLASFNLGRNVETGISPIKIFEYMACGRPFITTRVGAVYDAMIESCECGILVSPNDPTALAEAVIWLLGNPDQCNRLGQRGRQVAVDHYSWAKITEQIEQFII